MAAAEGHMERKGFRRAGRRLVLAEVRREVQDRSESFVAMLSTDPMGEEKSNQSAEMMEL
jgi:hypothetical protein